ncbi:cell division protein ZapE [Spartinivicinus poritis]|uniref:Cell division protein ZapE n=1 Tax=Spartinivicinus poritis TaxID=2994640 RepID=A0ABT5U8Y7_9GAMM|nr:cell division protein ZapE [Spartinivicinus sp. A2-2]MDE1462767.1 cell division protein ZapE [Spartinivicinus sp. A2-2]
MTPWERYQQDLLREDFSYDAEQEKAVKHLQRLYEDLIIAQQEQSKPVTGWLKWFGQKKPVEPCQGLYFWGGVGRGKTYLVDTFFDSLPFENKMRTHFHRFMQRVHQELKTLKGEKNPLTIVAKRLSDEASVICFDEFFVSDITDAMILGGLFEQLFANGVTLVATSNIVPNELYKDGLQRQRFLPAIELVEKYTEVVNVDSGIDYRLRVLEQAEIYHHPLSAQATASMEDSFSRLVPDKAHTTENEPLVIEGRTITALKCCDDVVWFSFNELCDGPRSQNDYIELAKIFHTVLLSDIPQLTASNDDQARRFVNLIDEFYDRNVKVIMSAEVAIPNIYQGTQLAFVYERTTSRMLEMQSHEYLGRAHKA